MSQIKRQWCAMLAKLVSPMEPERAAKAFVDMLPMLPLDETLYNRATLEDAATCERRTSVPTYADLSKVLGHAAKQRLPAHIRMGYRPPEKLLPPPPPPTVQEQEHVRILVKALIAELKAKSQAQQTKRH